MRTYDSPYLADWFAISLRWLSLLGLTVGLGMACLLDTPVLASIFFGAMWNIIITILATLNRRLVLHRPLNLLADVVISLFLFQYAGGITGGLMWSGVMPIFTASLYYEMRGGLGIATVVSLLQTGLIYVYYGMGAPLQVIMMLAAFNITFGLVAGGISMRLMRQIRTVYQRQVDQRRESEHRVVMTERNRMQTFIRMVETISSSLNYRLVLDSVLELSASTVSPDREGAELIGAVLLFDDHDLRVEAGRGLSARDVKITFPAESGLLHETLQSGEPQISRDPAADPELNHLAALEGCKVVLAVPLRRGVEAYGIIIFAHANPEFFNKDRVELFDMMGHQAVIAIQNARLYQDLAEEKEHIVQTQEEARKKLARDLHDGPIQSVAAIAMRVDVARHMMAQSPADAGNELVKIEDLARRTTKELRHMLFTLRPLALETEGLVTALQTMADKTREVYQQNVQVEVDQEVVNQLELGKQTVVFYISEEAVNNARKHAEAAVILVRLRFFPKDHEIAVLEIIDNGKGFNAKEVLNSYNQRGSLGMVNLRERTDLVNGLLNIESYPGRGTRIQVFIPLSEEAADRLHRGQVTN